MLKKIFSQIFLKKEIFLYFLQKDLLFRNTNFGNLFWKNFLFQRKIFTNYFLKKNYCQKFSNKNVFKKI